MNAAVAARIVTEHRLEIELPQDNQLRPLAEQIAAEAAIKADLRFAPNGALLTFTAPRREQLLDFSKQLLPALALIGVTPK